MYVFIYAFIRCVCANSVCVLLPLAGDAHSKLPYTLYMYV